MDGGPPEPAAHPVGLLGHFIGSAEKGVDAFPEGVVLWTWDGPERDLDRKSVV